MAQVDTLIIGKWDYDNVMRIGETEPISPALLKILVGKNSYYQFSNNHRFKGYESDKYVYGTWQFSADHAAITLINQRGDIYPYRIAKLTADTLIFSIRKSYHTLVKTKDTAIAEIADTINEAQRKALTVKVSIKQLTGRWVLTSVQDTTQTPKINTMVTDVYKGAWYELRQDGICTWKMLKEEKRGKWALWNGNRSVAIIDNDGYGIVWDISFVSSVKLVLQRYGSDIKFTFKRE
jgi:hypothetical protein